MKQTSKQQQLGKRKMTVIEAGKKKKEECLSAGVVRKGPWTEQEDMKLVWFVRLFGERRWDFLAKVSGLNRSGKSCRLRWVNYLHPDLKRGRMSPDEERLVVELHAKWGNRWSRIARSMPGRTDNEIKNYWRTHTRKLKHKHQHQHQHQQEEEEETKVATSASAATSASSTTSSSGDDNQAHGGEEEEAASEEDRQLMYAGMDDQLLWNDGGIDAYASWSGATSSMMMVPSSPVWQWDDHYCCSTDSLWGHDEAFEYKKMLHSSS